MGTCDPDEPAPPTAARPAVPARRYRAVDEPRPVSSYVPPEPVPVAPSRRPPRLLRGLVVLAVVGGLLGLLSLTGAPRFPAPARLWGSGSASAVGGSAAAGAPAGAGVLAEHGGRPVAFDGCLPVHYVMRYDGAPPGADQLVQDAVAQLSAATGLVLVFEGATDELPAADRVPRQPERYGDRWAPVLLSWSDATSAAAPVSGPAVLDPDGRGSRIVTGQVVIDAEPADPAVLSSRLLHELGRLAGLTVADPVVAAGPGATPAYSPEALRALQMLGQGPCF